MSIIMNLQNLTKVKVVFMAFHFTISLDRVYQCLKNGQKKCIHNFFYHEVKKRRIVNYFRLTMVSIVCKTVSEGVTEFQAVSLVPFFQLYRHLQYQVPLQALKHLPNLEGANYIIISLSSSSADF